MMVASTLIPLLFIVPGAPPEGESKVPAEPVPTVPARAEPDADDPIARIDAAHACARRAQPACTLEWLTPLFDRNDRNDLRRDLALAPELARDVWMLAGRAYALVDDADAAREAFRRLRATGSRWRPEPDDDPRVLAAWSSATTPPQPGPPEHAPPPPASPPDMPMPLGTWSFAIGAGAAFPVGAAADRFDPGLAVALEIAFATCVPDPSGDDPAWYAVLRGHFASLPLADTVAAEPSQDRTLGVGATTLGMALRLRVAPAWHLMAQAGVGIGTFAIGPSDAALSFAVETSAGARWALDPAFALRLEVAGQWLIPFNGSRADGHPAVSLAAEFAF